MRHTTCLWCYKPMPADAHASSGHCSDPCREERTEYLKIEQRRKAEQARKRAARKRLVAYQKTMATLCEDLSAFFSGWNTCDCGFKRGGNGSDRPLACSAVCEVDRPDHDRHVAQLEWLRQRKQTDDRLARERQERIERRAEVVEHEHAHFNLNTVAAELGVHRSELLRHLEGHTVFQLGPRTIIITRDQRLMLAAVIAGQQQQNVYARQRLAEIEKRERSRDARLAYAREYGRRLRRLARLGAMVDAATPTEESNDADK